MAQSPTMLYSPVKTIADQQISLRGWGSGSIAQTDEMAFEGVNSLRVSSRNFFQGGVITFGSPVDLAGAFGDKANMLRLTFEVPDEKTTLSGGPAGGGNSMGPSAGGVSSMGPGSKPQNGKGGGVGPQGAGQGGKFGGGKGGLTPAGGSKGGAQAAEDQPVLSVIRVIVTTTDGKKSEAYIPVANSMKGERGWRQVAIPLQSITGFDRTNKDVKEVAFSGDTTATFYVGDIRVINDTTPITGEITSTRENLALGDEITLSARGFGGSSILKYEWDFDGDGKADAEGIAIKRKFRKPGDITVALTISDEAGLKKPYKTQIKIHVNP